MTARQVTRPQCVAYQCLPRSGLDAVSPDEPLAVKTKASLGIRSGEHNRFPPGQPPGIRENFAVDRRHQEFGIATVRGYTLNALKVRRHQDPWIGPTQP